MVIFLVVGYDILVGIMMFLFYNFFKYFEVLQKCYVEVDVVFGDRELQLEDIFKFKYIDVVMKEVFCFCGFILVFMRQVKEIIIIGGKYKIIFNESLVFNFKGFYNDFVVWGFDVVEFRLERFFNGGWERLLFNFWKFFGIGVCLCIGWYLVEQEVFIIMVMVLQWFVIEMVDFDYEFSMLLLFFCI